MIRHRSVWFGLFACLGLATIPLPAKADIPAGPWPWSRTPSRADRALIEANRKLIAEGKEPIRIEEPRRTGPFRSCGSGVGAGLAGIGVAWGLMWAGNRFAGRVAKK
jgi:hypothetical protein